MADDDQTTTESTEAPVTQSAAAAPEVKTFTQDEVNRLMAKTREETRQRVLKENKPAQQPAQTPPAHAEEPSEKLSMKELKAQLDETNRRLKFADLISGHPVDPALKGDFYDLYKAQNPGDDADWIERKAKLFVKQEPAATTTPAQPQAASPAEPAKPPPAAPTAPAKVAPTNGGLVDLFNLSPDQLARLGPQGLRAEFEKITSVGSQLSGAPQRPKAPQR